MSTHVAKLKRRPWLAALAVLCAAVCAPGSVAGYPGGGGTPAPPVLAIVGNPAPPAHVGMDNYTINVGATSSTPGCYMSSLDLYGTTGNAAGPTGAWMPKGSYNKCSGVGMSCDNTFTVVDEADGTFWWLGTATDTCSNSGWTNPFGPYYTP